VSPMGGRTSSYDAMVETGNLQRNQIIFKVYDPGRLGGTHEGCSKAMLRVIEYCVATEN
jgi:hypothetical protein